MRYHELFENTSKLSFKIETIGFHHDQSDEILTAFRNKILVGKIDFSVYNSEIHIKYMKSFEQRQGVATAMLKYLQNQFPDTEIEWGSLTDDGSKLFNKIKFKNVVNTDVTDLLKQLKILKDRELQYQALINAYETSPTINNKEKMQVVFDDWNNLNDEIWRLEQEIGDRKPFKRIIE